MKIEASQGIKAIEEQKKPGKISVQEFTIENFAELMKDEII